MADKDLPNIENIEFKMPDEEREADERKDTKLHTLPIVLGTLIVVLVLILAGLYLWGTSMQQQPSTADDTVRPTAQENNEPESNNAEADTQSLQTVSNSDELSAIESDIESTNLESLDSEMITLESELNAGAQ